MSNTLKVDKMNVADALRTLNLTKNNEQQVAAEKRAAAKNQDEAVEDDLDFQFLYKTNQGSRFEYVETSLKSSARPNALRGLNAVLGREEGGTKGATSPGGAAEVATSSAMPRRNNVSLSDEARFANFFSEIPETVDGLQLPLEPPAHPPAQPQEQPSPQPQSHPQPEGYNSLLNPFPPPPPAARTEEQTEESRLATKLQVDELSQRCLVARNLREQESLPEAEAEFRVCLRMLIVLLGPTHMETIRCMQNLAECLFAQGELQVGDRLIDCVLSAVEARGCGGCVAGCDVTCVTFVTCVWIMCSSTTVVHQSQCAHTTSHTTTIRW